MFKPGENPVITALLEAFASSDDEVAQQISNTKAQLFVRTAEGTPLNKLANSLGVARPVELGLDDATFQELIPNLSLKAKQVRKAFYDTADVFWGPFFSRANTETANAEPFNLVAGDKLVVQVDSREQQTIVVLASDVAVSGAATAAEAVAILSKIRGTTAVAVEDALTGDVRIRLRTNTPGPLGSIEVFDSSTMIASGKLEFEATKTELRDQGQRVAIYEIRPNEVVIEIPAVVPALRRTLRGSHHFHEDSTLEAPVPPGNGVWAGSFLYDKDGDFSSYTVSSQKAKLDQTITKGTVLTHLVVDDTADIETVDGYLVLAWGTSKQEGPVRMRGVPNSKTILIDPSYVFQQDHAANDYVNVLATRTAYPPRKNGQDLAIYLTSPSGAREAVQAILRTLAAAGIILNFVVLAPDYKYLANNPYISDDDPPAAS